MACSGAAKRAHSLDSDHVARKAVTCRPGQITTDATAGGETVRANERAKRTTVSALNGA